MGVGAGDDLLVRRDDSLDEGGMVGGRDFAVAGETAEVVDAFKDDEPADAGGCEDVAIEAGKNVGTESVCEKVIAANGLVGDADVVRGG